MASTVQRVAVAVLLASTVAVGSVPASADPVRGLALWELAHSSDGTPAFGDVLDGKVMARTYAHRCFSAQQSARPEDLDFAASTSRQHARRKEWSVVIVPCRNGKACVTSESGAVWKSARECPEEDVDRQMEDSLTLWAVTHAQAARIIKALKE